MSASSEAHKLDLLYTQNDYVEENSKEESNVNSLQKNLQNLVTLMADATEAYSAVILLSDNERRTLKVSAFHSLSRDFIKDATIPFSSGLIGWTAENKVRISVCPFENDSRTLLYYTSNQDLKSFIAIPILNDNKELLGVLCCDSKKSYAFAKLVEKVLHDLATQASLLIELDKKLKTKQENIKVDISTLDVIINELRKCKTEEELLSASCSIPQEIIKREALVVITTADHGVGEGAYYSISDESKFNHRLLELVCKHKKIICPDRSVHVTSSSKSDRRSFLSVPFKVMGREAGSFNLISSDNNSFKTSDISSLEIISKAVGERLEHIRLRESIGGIAERTPLLSWRFFESKAKKLLNEAKRDRRKMKLVRISLSRLSDIEDIAGVGAACEIIEKISRIVEQVSGVDSASCSIYGGEFLILTTANELSNLKRKFEALLKRVNIETKENRFIPRGLSLNQLLLNGTIIKTAMFPQEAKTLNDLIARTNTAKAM